MYISIQEGCPCNEGESYAGVSTKVDTQIENQTGPWPIFQVHNLWANGEDECPNVATHNAEHADKYIERPIVAEEVRNNVNRRGWVEEFYQ